MLLNKLSQQAFVNVAHEVLLTLVGLRLNMHSVKASVCNPMQFKSDRRKLSPTSSKYALSPTKTQVFSPALNDLQNSVLRSVICGFLGNAAST